MPTEEYSPLDSDSSANSWEKQQCTLYASSLTSLLWLHDTNWSWTYTWNLLNVMIQSMTMMWCLYTREDSSHRTNLPGDLQAASSLSLCMLDNLINNTASVEVMCKRQYSKYINEVVVPQIQWHFIRVKIWQHNCSKRFIQYRPVNVLAAKF